MRVSSIEGAESFDVHILHCVTAMLLGPEGNNYRSSLGALSAERIVVAVVRSPRHLECAAAVSASMQLLSLHWWL